MSGKKPAHMGEYVHNKNADLQGARQLNAPSPGADLDDLKADVPKTGVVPNSGQARINGSHHNKAVQGRAVPQSDGNGLAGQRRFYDTDASSIDTSSATSNVKQDYTLVEHDVQSDGQILEPDDHASEDSERESDDENVHYDDRINLNPKQKNLMATTDHDLSKSEKYPGASLPHTKGDSYPETTSGRPSIAGSTEEEVADTKSIVASQARGQAYQTTPMRQRLNTSNVQNQPHAQQSHAHHYNQSPAEGGFLAQPKVGIGGPLEGHIPAGSAFGRPNNRPVSTQPPTSKGRPSSNVADRGVTSTTNASSHRTLHSAQNALHPAVQGTKLPHRSHQDELRPSTNAAVPNPARQQGTSLAPQHEPLSDVDFDGLSTNAEPQEHAHDPEEPSLDYYAPDLYYMDYKELKAQPFDTDPNADKFKFPDGFAASSLEEKLRAVADLDQKSQAEYFTGLPIGEWEQAGDWFLTRFGDVLTKLKANRREKREAAQSFENEIEKRHAAVSKKRKQTEDELIGMKESGVKVLQGTPKKTKTK